MPTLVLPPADVPSNNGEQTAVMHIEEEGDSMDEQDEQPSSPYQPFTTAMAGIPAPALTPPMGATPISAQVPADQWISDSSEDDEEFEEGEYVVSDTAEEDNGENEDEDTEGENGDSEDNPPDCQNAESSD